MSAEEIREGIEQLARDGEGADKRWALKQLSAATTEESALAKPLTDYEVTHRLARIMRGAGDRLTRAAYVIAHGGYDKRRSKNKMPSPVEPDGLSIDRNKLPKTLQQFNRKYPHLKQAGFPEGYPVGKDPGTQVVWIENRAYEVEMQILRAKAADALKDIGDLSALPTDGVDGEKSDNPSP